MLPPHVGLMPAFQRALRTPRRDVTAAVAAANPPQRKVRDHAFTPGWLGRRHTAAIAPRCEDVAMTSLLEHKQPVRLRGAHRRHQLVLEPAFGGSLSRTQQP